MALALDGGAYPQPSRMTRTRGLGRIRAFSGQLSVISMTTGDCKSRNCRTAELRNCRIEKQSEPRRTQRDTKLAKRIRACNEMARTIVCEDRDQPIQGRVLASE